MKITPVIKKSELINRRISAWHAELIFESVKSLDETDEVKKNVLEEIIKMLTCS